MYNIIRTYKGIKEVVDSFNTMAEAIAAIPGYKEAYGSSSSFDIKKVV